jgi:hypothetical protein
MFNSRYEWLHWLRTLPFQRLRTTQYREEWRQHQPQRRRAGLFWGSRSVAMPLTVAVWKRCLIDRTIHNKVSWLAKAILADPLNDLCILRVQRHNELWGGSWYWCYSCRCCTTLFISTASKYPHPLTPKNRHQHSHIIKYSIHKVPSKPYCWSTDSDWYFTLLAHCSTPQFKSIIASLPEALFIVYHILPSDWTNTNSSISPIVEFAMCFISIHIFDAFWLQADVKAGGRVAEGFKYTHWQVSLTLWLV